MLLIQFPITRDSSCFIQGNLICLRWNKKLVSKVKKKVVRWAVAAFSFWRNVVEESGCAAQDMVGLRMLDLQIMLCCCCGLAALGTRM